MTWEAAGPLPGHTVFFQLIGPDNRVRGQHDGDPLDGRRPAAGWLPGERVEDRRGLPIAADAPPGVYHGTASGETTWYGLARAVFARAGHDPDRVRPTTSDRFVRPAPRPAYSVLGHARWARAGMTPMTDWETMLSAYLGSPRA
jgi:dTDP-4-dehydrorhamnose reductase